ncbi:hypothetical protein GCM10009712_20670 [Pseudarthrobacter sulfonivorans]
MKANLIITESEPRGDLTENVQQALQEDGEHVVYDDGTGRRLVAHVSNGRVVEWKAFDSNGGEVATIEIRQPPTSAGGNASMARARWAIVCACFESGDFCWWEPY